MFTVPAMTQWWKLGIACLVIALVSSLTARTFTDAAGREIEAEIVRYAGGNTVLIRRADGQEFNLDCICQQGRCGIGAFYH